VKLLLDTQCWLWMAAEPARFGAAARRHLQDGRNELCLSSVSAMEISIKYSIGKLPLHIPPAEFLPSLMNFGRVSLILLNIDHAIRLASLPFHHRDPFDRLLIAQAQVENLRLMTADEKFRSYDVDLIAAA
jgi:PIN domain nuclease of toxin-antitoxin system